MNLYLIKDQIVTFPRWSYIFGGECMIVKSKDLSIPLKLEPVLEPEECNLERSTKIEKPVEVLRVLEKDLNKTSKFRILLTRISGNKLTDIKLVNGASGILQLLSSICSRENLKINLEFTIVDPDAGPSIKAEGLLVQQLTNFDVPSESEERMEYGCEQDVALNTRTISSSAGFSARVTATLVLNDEAVTSLLRYGGIHQKISWSKNKKRILDDPICSDLVIVAKNGVEIQCHKVFLAAQSEVFEAMFQSKMKEDTEGRLEMRDMSEAGIRAFLAVVYHWDFSDTFASWNVVMEVIRAGHKYLMGDVVTAISVMICEKPNNWFSVDMAVELLQFARSLPEVEGMKDKLVSKAVVAIQWHAKTEPNRLLDSVEYKDLFQNHPQVAMELTVLLLKHGGYYNEDLSFDSLGK